MEDPIIWINNPLKYKITNPNDKEITKNKINNEKKQEKREEKYNYEYDCTYDFDWQVSYKDFSVSKPGCGRKRSPSFMKTMFSHS
tara:strand:- start:52 stop:306 length:255 start_codon:yes stop_codon:yes gene_type:complete